MDEEQEITLMTSIRTIEGIGNQAAEILEAAGFVTVQQLRCFDGHDRQLQDALDARRQSYIHEGITRPRSYWRRLRTRCINVIYRARSAEAVDFVPCEYMCPLSLDWFDDPVVVASGNSYSREYIVKHLMRSPLDPLTRMNIGGQPMYASRRLA